MKNYNANHNKQKLGVWQKGGPSPNPTGRPAGCKNKITQLRERILEEAAAEAAEAAEAACYLVKRGDPSTVRWALDKLLPRGASAPLKLNFPQMHSVEDTFAATTQVMGAVTGGKITPDEGIKMMSLLHQCARQFQLKEVSAISH